jgi:outer membrane protein assembly factor BamB
MHPDGRGDVTQTHIEWSTGKGVPSRPSLLIVDGRLYMVNNGGVVTCLDARNGKRLWSERLGGEYWASPVVVCTC